MPTFGTVSNSKYYYDAENDLGIVPEDASAAAANTAALQAYHTQNATEKMPALVFRGKDYYFSGQLHDGNDAGFRSFFWQGTMGPEFAAQHLEDGALIKRNTRFIIQDLASTSTPWLRITGSETVQEQPRGLRFKDIVFWIPSGHTGCIFDFGFGDPAIAGDDDASLIRSINIDNCYFTEEDHIANGTKGTQWLTDEGVEGFCLNRTQGEYLVRMSRCYDISIKAGFRGSNGPQLWLQNCDAPTCKTRHLLAWQALRSCITDNDHFLDDEGVPGWYEVYCETPFISAIFANAGSINARVETGYDKAVNENIGVYGMPADITWYAAPNSAYVEFTGLPGVRTVADYFEPGMVMKLTPVAGGEFTVGTVTSSTQFEIELGSDYDHAYVGRAITHAAGTSFGATNTNHARTIATWDGTTKVATIAGPVLGSIAEDHKVRIANDHDYNLIVTEVDSATNRVYFAQHAGTCKILRAITGGSAQCKRLFGQECVLTGERVELNRASLSHNTSYPDLPTISVALSKKNIRVNNGYPGSGPDPTDNTQDYLMCSHCRPQNYVSGHVQALGYKTWEHPYVQQIAGVRFNQNVSLYADPDYSRMYPFFWKAGVHENAVGNSQALPLMKLTDGLKETWVYYLGNTAWLLPTRNCVTGNWAARVWSPQAYTGTFKFRFEESNNFDEALTYSAVTWSPIDVNVAAGWQILTWSGSEVDPDAFRIAQRDLFVEWVGMTPS